MKFLVLLLAAVLAAAQTVCAVDEYPTRIPEAISVCYVDPVLANRHQRLPLSVDNLIAIVRKVEAHPDTALWSVAKMTGTLLRRFRYDGIIDNLQVAPGTIPISRDHVETDKYSLQWQVIPGHGSDFPETALTQQEKCSLHWMLSYSVNRTQRAEERAPMRSAPFAAPASDTGRQMPPSAAIETPSAATPGAATPGTETPGTFPGDSDEQISNSGEEEHDPDFALDPPPVDAEESAEDADHADHHRRRRRDTMTHAAGPLSAHPLELGVVRTPWGTVAAGVLLAGIAAGLEPQTVMLKSLIKDPILEISESSKQRMVDSRWVATLAGDLAQTALLKASATSATIGPRSKWNSTFCPRESSLQVQDPSMLTIAEIYGGIDGLLAAQNVKNWDNNYMKLSHIIEMYYSENGVYGNSRFRACNRLNNFNDPTIVDPAMLKEQSLNAALIYYADGMTGSPSISPQSRPVDVLGNFVSVTYNEMIKYLGSFNEVDQDFLQCQGDPPIPIVDIPATYTDLTFVLDQFSDPLDIEHQKEMAATLATLMDIQVGGSRMEIVSSKDGTPFFTLSNTTNKAELACMIGSLDIRYGPRSMADVLNRMRSRIAEERSTDRLKKVTGANSRTILFFVNGWTSGTAEKDKLRDQLLLMKKEMPDVNVMFATLASAEEFRPFVNRFERDIIRMNTFTTYVQAAPVIASNLAQVPARLQYPACKDLTASGSSAESSFVYNGFLNPKTTQYFRLGPEHFFASQGLTLRFKSTYGVVKFCWSNTNDRPGLKDQCSNALKADETVEFKLVQPCARLPEVGTCPPIYISAAPVNVDDGIPCSEKDCHTPDQVKFTFTHDGMRCSSVAALVSNASLIGALLLSWLMINFSKLQ